MQLRDLSNDDQWLNAAIHCDPAMMSELGGPLPSEGLAEKLHRDVADVASDACWISVIVPDDDPSAAAGTVSVWSHVVDGESVNEIGWMVLPPFQGAGLGSAARSSRFGTGPLRGPMGVLNAFPPVTNPRSNAMCRKMGFVHLGERDFVFRDRSLRCNHRRLDLRAR